MSYILPARKLPEENECLRFNYTRGGSHLSERPAPRPTDRRTAGVSESAPLLPLRLPVLAELDLSYDENRRVLWQFMRPAGRPSFTPGLLRDMTHALDLVEETGAAAVDDIGMPVRYMVLASRMPGIFNLGGDLPHFMRLIDAADRSRLSWYAQVCARGQYRRTVSVGLPICTIALVQGDALGGGFEAALAHDVIVAEKGTSFGLPEVLFNMFPGMGAYSFLARRLDPVRAERIILSGRIYRAEELFEMGVVDRLAEPGFGTETVCRFIDEFDRARPSRLALLKARKLLQPVTLEELSQIADMWVDAALRLTPGDLRRMSHLAKAQDRRLNRLGGDGLAAEGP